MVTPAMVEIDATDTETDEIGWMAYNFTWFSGYSPTHFREALDLLIRKTYDDNCAHQILLILLFDLEANMHNKSLRRTSMELSEDCMGIDI